MTPIECDVAVIGAGTAGLAAERRARKSGARTVIIDPAFRGTTCAAVGCMPSKVLIQSGEVAHAARTAGEFGIGADPQVDGRAVMRRVRTLRDHFVQGVKDGFADIPTKLTGKARFTSATTLVLETGEEIRAKAIVIATGSSPLVPDAYKALGDIAMTTDTVFEMEDLPRSLAVIGGGPVGTELAQAFARLGVKVALFDEGSDVAGLKGSEAQRMVDLLRAEMDVHLDVSPRPRLEGAGAVIEWEAGTFHAEKVLVAVGRPPNLKGLNLEAAGLTLNDHGGPVYDRDSMQCGDSSIFIAGDVDHDRPLLHEATAEGTIAGANASSYPDVQKARRKVPLAITFTHPNVAVVGKVPDGVDTVTGHADYSDQGRARIEGRNAGFARIEADDKGKILAATLCTPEAEHIGHFFALAIGAGMTAADLLDQPIYHPTLEEGLRGALAEICEGCRMSVPWDRRSGSQPGDI